MKKPARPARDLTSDAVMRSTRRAESKARVDAAVADLKRRLPRAILEAHVIKFLDRLEVANNISPIAVSEAILAIRTELTKNNIFD